MYFRWKTFFRKKSTNSVSKKGPKEEEGRGSLKKLYQKYNTEKKNKKFTWNEKDFL